MIRSANEDPAAASTAIGVGDGGRGARAPPPNSGENVFFGQTSCNIRAVDILLEEGRIGTLYFLTVFCLKVTIRPGLSILYLWVLSLISRCPGFVLDLKSSEPVIRTQR